jgi:dynein heavy chain 1
VLIKDRKINEWLTLVEKEMRLTLAHLLAQAVEEIAAFKNTNIKQSDFMLVNHPLHLGAINSHVKHRQRP